MIEAKAARDPRVAFAEAGRQWAGWPIFRVAVIRHPEKRRGVKPLLKEYPGGVAIWLPPLGEEEVLELLKQFRDLLREVDDLPGHIAREVVEGPLPGEEEVPGVLFVRTLGILLLGVLEERGKKPFSSRIGAPRARIRVREDGYLLHLWWGRYPSFWTRIRVQDLKNIPPTRGGYVLEVKREEVGEFLEELAGLLSFELLTWVFKA